MIGCACSDYCFDAENAFDFLARIQSTHTDYSRTINLTYRELVQQIVVESRLTPDTLTFCSGLTTLDLFTLISCTSRSPSDLPLFLVFTRDLGIHSMIFCQQSSLSLTEASVRMFQTAVQNWLDIWNLRAPDPHILTSKSRCSDDEDMPRSSTFTRHAREYASLATAKLAIFLRNEKRRSTSALASETILLTFEPYNIANIVHEALALGSCF